MVNFDIEEIKKEIDFDLDDTLEDKFEDKFSEIINDEIEMAKLFACCFDIININLEKLGAGFKNWFDEYLTLYQEIRSELVNYESGKGFGDWAIEERIKNIVIIHRYSLIKFLEVFKNIFIE